MTAQPLIVETIVADGARHRVSWFDPPFRPPLEATAQALGICFTPEFQVVLVTWNDADWTLPGGTIEPGETLEQTLAREVREEACARGSGLRLHRLPARRAARGRSDCLLSDALLAGVELDPFTPTHEMTVRQVKHQRRSMTDIVDSANQPE